MTVYMLAFIAAIMLASWLPVRFTLRMFRAPAERAFATGTYKSRLAGNGAMLGAVTGLLAAFWVPTTLLFIGSTTSFGVTVITIPMQYSTSLPLTMQISQFFQYPELALKLVAVLLKGFAFHVLPEIVLLALIGAGGGLLHGYIRRPNAAVPG